MRVFLKEVKSQNSLLVVYNALFLFHAMPFCENSRNISIENFNQKGQYRMKRGPGSCPDLLAPDF